MIDQKWLDFGKELIALVESYAEPRAIPIDPKSEVECEHEPLKISGSSGFIYIHECKHCKVQLKAEKWVEA